MDWTRPHGPDTHGASPAHPFAGSTRVDVAVAGVASLRLAVAAAAGAHVLVIDGALAPVGEDWLWEAIGILDLLPQVACVGGRVAGQDGTILAGELLFEPGGRVSSPLAGRSILDPGPYAYSLKPHLTDAVSGRFFVARRAWLEAALASLPAVAGLGNLGAWLGACALEDGCAVAWSPLFAAAAPSGWTGEERPGLPETDALGVRLPAGSLGRAGWRRRWAELAEGRFLPPPG